MRQLQIRSESSHKYSLSRWAEILLQLTLFMIFCFLFQLETNEPDFQLKQITTLVLNHRPAVRELKTSHSLFLCHFLRPAIKHLQVHQRATWTLTTLRQMSQRPRI